MGGVCGARILRHGNVPRTKYINMYARDSKSSLREDSTVILMLIYVMRRGGRVLTFTYAKVSVDRGKERRADSVNVGSFVRYMI